MYYLVENSSDQAASDDPYGAPAVPVAAIVQIPPQDRCSRYTATVVGSWYLFMRDDTGDGFLPLMVVTNRQVKSRVVLRAGVTVPGRRATIDIDIKRGFVEPRPRHSTKVDLLCHPCWVASRTDPVGSVLDY